MASFRGGFGAAVDKETYLLYCGKEKPWKGWSRGSNPACGVEQGHGKRCIRAVRAARALPPAESLPSFGDLPFGKRGWWMPKASRENTLVPPKGRRRDPNALQLNLQPWGEGWIWILAQERAICGRIPSPAADPHISCVPIASLPPSKGLATAPTPFLPSLTQHGAAVAAAAPSQQAWPGADLQARRRSPQRGRAPPLPGARSPCREGTCSQFS